MLTKGRIRQGSVDGSHMDVPWSWSYPVYRDCNFFLWLKLQTERSIFKTTVSVSSHFDMLESSFLFCVSIKSFMMFSYLSHPSVVSLELSVKMSGGLLVLGMTHLLHMFAKRLNWSHRSWSKVGRFIWIYLIIWNMKEMNEKWAENSWRFSAIPSAEGLVEVLMSQSGRLRDVNEEMRRNVKKRNARCFMIWICFEFDLSFSQNCQKFWEFWHLSNLARLNKQEPDDSAKSLHWSPFHLHSIAWGAGWRASVEPSGNCSLQEWKEPGPSHAVHQYVSFLIWAPGEMISHDTNFGRYARRKLIISYLHGTWAFGKASTSSQNLRKK